jgi:hypothetical protein
MSLLYNSVLLHYAINGRRKDDATGPGWPVGGGWIVEMNSQPSYSKLRSIFFPRKRRKPTQL